jgi:hypothetical protein
MATLTLPAEPAGRRRTAVRSGLALLGAGQGATALFALLAPHAFFRDFPVGGAHWVSAFAPYNEHLIRDYGASFLALSVLALAAAWSAEPRLVRVALAVWLVASVPHLAFHVAHAGLPGGASGAASLAALALNVVVPVWLFVLVPKEPDA